MIAIIAPPIQLLTRSTRTNIPPTFSLRKKDENKTRAVTKTKQKTALLPAKAFSRYTKYDPQSS